MIHDHILGLVICTLIVIVVFILMMHAGFMKPPRDDGEIQGVTVVAVLLGAVLYGIYFGGKMVFEKIQTGVQSYAYSATPVGRIENRLNDISQLCVSLEEKIKQSKIFENNLVAGIKKYRTTLEEERASKGIADFRQADSDNVISSYLETIGRKAAYLTVVRKKRNELEKGLIDARKMEEQARDEQAYAKVFNDADSAKLSKRIDEIISKYSSDPEDPVIDEKSVVRLTNEQVWNMLQSKKI